ncbi:cytochrome P450 76T24-like [Coffea arabica]|uniref:Cytochrome P450 76T24-like n=1 Tax=Coffea arabica TaxID=13443 RepID=A0ABM4W367_COFAR
MLAKGTVKKRWCNNFVIMSTIVAIKEEAVDIGAAAFTTSLNFLSNTLFSVDFADYESNASQEVIEIISGVVGIIAKPNLSDFFPMLPAIDPQAFEATSSTVEWAIADLLRNPEKREKARSEIREVVGQHKLVQESDILALPYLKAIVKETFRLHPPVTTVSRYYEADVEIDRYIVPKNTLVLVNIRAIGRDSSLWSNPESFVPERLLDSEIDVKGQHFELLPFGTGRRICPGIPLGDRMVHLMVASFLHTFDWKLEARMRPEDMDMKEKLGITMHKAHSSWNQNVTILVTN